MRNIGEIIEGIPDPFLRAVMFAAVVGIILLAAGVCAVLVVLFLGGMLAEGLGIHPIKMQVIIWGTAVFVALYKLYRAVDAEGDKRKRG